MTRRRGARSLDAIELPPWRAVGFTDLHVSAKTIDRALEVLRRTREAALEHDAFVVCTGDFWDARRVLAVRQLDAILDEFHEWHRWGLEVVLVPGNHDQVSMSGRVHGLRAFEAFPRFTVATERVLWPERKIAFIPWREDPEEQAAQYELPGEGWTIFAHAEVEGATTNYAHRAPGRVMVRDLERVARAVYCGHYHKRQQIGDRVWYLGSPFQMTFGEMNDPPKGLALVTSEQLEPAWLPLEGFPRHHRVVHGESFEPASIARGDVVELYVPRDMLGTDEAAELRASIPAADVRPLPLEADAKELGEVAFALSLDQAVEGYVDQALEEAEAEGRDLVPGDVGPDDLKGLARVILSELPDAASVNPIAPVVEVCHVEITDFCAIRGRLEMDFADFGLGIITGPVGTGKTAFVDAVTWCLYGQTAPRKAGSSAAAFRGDEVINDVASECRVVVQLRLYHGEESTDVTIERAKKRGKGASATVSGIDAPEGIDDDQDLINRVVGLPAALWRTCVSLGQGAVGNFVTDADKARKTLLADAFGLSVCPDAQKLIKARLKPIRAKLETVGQQRAGIEARIDALGSTDYTAEIRQWEAVRAAAMDGARQAGEEAHAKIAECDQHLEQEGAWLERKQQHEAHRDQLVQQLAGLGLSSGLARLERECGALEAEKAVIEGQLAKARASYGGLVKSAQGGGMPCPTCGQPMQQGDVAVLIGEREAEIKGLERQLTTFGTKLNNLHAQMGAQQQGGEAQREQLQVSLGEAKDALEKIGEALATFARIRANRERAVESLEAARHTYTEQETEKNPWSAKQAEVEKRIAEHREQIAKLEQEETVLAEQVGALEFWERGFGAKGLPVLVLRTALYELETYANRFLAMMLRGRIYVQLVMTDEDLGVRLFEQCIDGEVRERRYEALSGGQRRCVELAFSPFAISEMVFARCGVRVPFLVVDELTTHLGEDEKPMAVEILRQLERSAVLVIDHDVGVQGEFDAAYRMEQSTEGTALRRVMQ